MSLSFLTNNSFDSSDRERLVDTVRIESHPSCSFIFALPSEDCDIQKEETRSLSVSLTNVEHGLVAFRKHSPFVTKSRPSQFDHRGKHQKPWTRPISLCDRLTLRRLTQHPRQEAINSLYLHSLSFSLKLFLLAFSLLRNAELASGHLALPGPFDWPQPDHHPIQLAKCKRDRPIPF